MIRCIKNIAIAGGLHQMAAFGAGSLNHDAADCELRSKAETLAAPPFDVISQTRGQNGRRRK